MTTSDDEVYAYQSFPFEKKSQIPFSETRYNTTSADDNVSKSEQKKAKKICTMVGKKKKWESRVEEWSDVVGWEAASEMRWWKFYVLLLLLFATAMFVKCGEEMEWGSWAVEIMSTMWDPINVTRTQFSIYKLTIIIKILVEHSFQSNDNKKKSYLSRVRWASSCLPDKITHEELCGESAN